MVNELQARLHSLYNGRMSLPQVGPQMCGLERYRIIASGEQLYTLLAAADRIAELEAANERLLSLCQRWSESCTGRHGSQMQCVKTCSAPSDSSSALDREGKHE